MIVPLVAPMLTALVECVEDAPNVVIPHFPAGPGANDELLRAPVDRSGKKSAIQAVRDPLSRYFRSCPRRSGHFGSLPRRQAPPWCPGVKSARVYIESLQEDLLR